MASYYDDRSLLQGAGPVQFDVGALAKAGALTQQALGGVRERELEESKLAREAKRFAREQELNARQDTEYNREIGLRTARQDLSKEFLTNPYAAKFGSGKETALLDKQVIDYVNGGGVIDDDMARRLQTKYEEARSFREDAKNALTSQMVLAGEDPTKAAQMGTELSSNLLSRVEQQAAVSANRKIEQDQYDEAAKRNKEALQLRFDIAKANSENDKDKAELLFKQYQNMNGGGTGGGSSGTNVLMETLGKIGPLDAAKFMAKNGPRDLAIQAGYTDAQIAKAAGQGLDTDPTSWTWADNTIDTAAFTRNLGMQQPGSGLSKSINIRDIQAPTAEEWASIVPNRAGYRVVDYDPKRFLEGSKGVLPELFGKDTEKPLLSEVAKDTTEKKSGDTLADRNNNYGNIKYNPKDDWIGGRKDPNSAFVKFDTPELGARALAKTIINGSAGLTIDQYINKYAPASDNNDTKSYIADVAKALNKKPDELIKSEDVPAIMKAIGKREGGNYSDDVLKEGYRLAVNPTTQDKDMLSRVMEIGPKKDSAFLKAIDPSNIKDNYNNQVHTNVPPSTIAELYPKEQKPIEVRSGFKQIGDIMSEGLKTTYEEGKKGAKEFVIPLVKPAYDNLFGKDGSQKINTGKALLNNSAAGMLEIAGSPYTAMKRFTDYMVYGESQGDSVFQKNAQNARATAISELNKSGIENPSDQEIAMFVSDVLMPVGGLAKTGKTTIGLMPKLETDYGKLLTNVATKDANVASAIEKLNASKRGAQYADEAKEFERQVLQKERQAATNTPESVRNTTSELVNMARREDVVIKTSKNILEGINTKGPLSAADQVEILNALEVLQKVTSRSAIEVLREMKLSPKVERYIMDSLKQTK